ncbi:MAG TPA: RNA polymerase subunit sigma-70 [Plesiomonas shigelloides]|nr:RNA polymerase subunit sigma-70 [Plesiomonas shigelloides]
MGWIPFHALIPLLLEAAAVLATFVPLTIISLAQRLPMHMGIYSHAIYLQCQVIWV